MCKACGVVVLALLVAGLALVPTNVSAQGAVQASITGLAKDS